MSNVSNKRKITDSSDSDSNVRCMHLPARKRTSQESVTLCSASSPLSLSALSVTLFEPPLSNSLAPYKTFQRLIKQRKAQEMLWSAVEEYEDIQEGVDAASKRHNLEAELSRLTRRQKSYKDTKARLDLSTKRRDQYRSLVETSKNLPDETDFDALDCRITESLEVMVRKQKDVTKRLARINQQKLEDDLAEATSDYREATEALDAQEEVVRVLRKKREERLSIAKGIKSGIKALGAVLTELEE